MNKQKKLHQRSVSIGHFGNSQIIQSLMSKLEQSQSKRKELEEHITNLVSKIKQKDKAIELLQRQNQLLLRQQQQLVSKIQESQIIDSQVGLNTLGQSIQDITNVDQNELNIKNRMESMKTFQINKMPTLFQRNMRHNRSLQKLHKVVFHGRILQLKPSNIRSKQPQSPTGIISLKDQLPIKQQPQIDAPLKLFQNFLVVAGDISQLDSSLVLDPKIVYCFPQKISLDKERTIPLFCFPNKIECLEVENQEKRDTIEESSIFILNSQYTTLNKTNKTISCVNPNHYLYGICMTTYSYAKSGNSFYQIPITYVILTYFPFIKFWNDIMLQAVKSSKPSSNILINQKWMRQSLKEINQVKIRSFPFVIKCNIFNKSQNISFDEPRYIDNQVLSYSNNCIAKLNHAILSDLLLYFLLEYSIVIYSSNKTLQSQLITLILQVIKPLKYPYPIITDLPPEMEPMLDSPFPCVLGISSHLDSSLSQSHVFVDLDNNKITKIDIKELYYVFDYTRDSIKSKYSNENQVVKRLKYLVRQQILNGKDKKSIMTPFLQKFKNTQIYKYNHQ